MSEQDLGLTMEEELLAIYVAVAMAMYKDIRILDITVKLDTNILADSINTFIRAQQEFQQDQHPFQIDKDALLLGFNLFKLQIKNVFSFEIKEDIRGLLIPGFGDHPSTERSFYFHLPPSYACPPILQAARSNNVIMADIVTTRNLLLTSKFTRGSTPLKNKSRFNDIPNIFATISLVKEIIDSRVKLKAINEMDAEPDTLDFGECLKDQTTREYLISEEHFGNDAQTYNDCLRRRGMGTVEYYAKNGILDKDRRIHFVTKNMNATLSHVLTTLTSENLYKSSKLNDKKVKEISRLNEDFKGYMQGQVDKKLNLDKKSLDLAKEFEYFEERGDEQMMHAVEICELIAGAQSNGTVITPVMAVNGIITLLSNISRSGIELLSSRRFACSRTSATKIIKSLIKKKIDSAIDKLRSVWGNDIKLVLLNIDNYVTKMWTKFKVSDEAFTHLTATIAVLFCIVDKAARPTRPPMLPPEQEWVCPKIGVPLDFDLVKQIIQHGTLDIPETLQNVVDENFLYQGLRTQHVYPNLHGKSSSRSDTMEIVIKQFMEERCQISTNEICLLSDCEYVLHFILLTYLYPLLLCNVFLCLAALHLRMHAMYNLVYTPVHHLLMFPFFWKMGRSRDKLKAQTQTLLKKMLDRINSSSSTTMDVNQLLESETKALNMVEKCKLDKAREQDVSENAAVNNVHNIDDALNDRNDQNLENDDEEDLSDLKVNESDDLYYQNPARIFSTIFSFIKAGGIEDNTAFSYKELQAVKIRFASLQVFVQQLVQARRELILTHEFKHLIDNSQSWALKFLDDFILNGLDAECVLPFDKLNDEGRGQLVVSKLVNHAALMSIFSRDNVARADLGIIHTTHNLMQNRPDVAHAYFSNCTKMMQDENIENLNSSTQARMKPGQIHTPAAVSNAAVESELKRDTLGALRRNAQLKETSSSKHTGEIRYGWSRIKRGKLKDDLVKIKQFVMVYYRSLDTLTYSAPLEPPRSLDLLEDTSRFMDTMQGLIAKGREITIRVADKYKGYLDKKRKDKDKVKSQEDDELAQDEDYKYLIEIDPPFLKAFNVAHGLPYSADSRPKLIKDMFFHKKAPEGGYSRDDFNDWVIDENIMTIEQAKDFLAKKKEVTKEMALRKKLENDNKKIERALRKADSMKILREKEIQIENCNDEEELANLKNTIQEDEVAEAEEKGEVEEEELEELEEEEDASTKESRKLSSGSDSSSNKRSKN